MQRREREADRKIENGGEERRQVNQ